MRLRDVLAAVNGTSISLNLNPEVDIRSGFAADLMSDALRYDLSQALLITGLAGVQVVRTAEMTDVGAIMVVRSKMPEPAVLDLAEEIGIPLLGTDLTMFEACGRLHAAGLPACQRFNGRSG